MTDQRKLAEARRQERLEAALRANLKRRKAQVRGRAASEPADSDRPGDADRPQGPEKP